LKLVEYTWPELILPELVGQSKTQVVAELAQHLARTQFDINAEELTQDLMEREALASTAIGDGVAIPHCKFAAATRLFICLGRSAKGVSFGSPDGQPTHLFFLLVAPENMATMHLKALACIGRRCKNAECRARLMKAETAAELFRVLQEEGEEELVHGIR
jgi:PTS system nitrogen regulatory IIA component